MSSPYSAGGGGTQLETRVAASCIAAVLCEAPVRGLPGDFATASSRSGRHSITRWTTSSLKGFGWGHGREVQLDLQVKNKLTFDGERCGMG